MKARRGEVAKDIATITKMTVKQLGELPTKPRTQGLQAAIAAVLLRAINDGDAKALNAILDRILGKIKEHKLG